MDSITHLRQKAKEHLSEYRYRHTLGCERAAVRLAERYGENPTWCAMAALLHDWTKEETVEQQLKLCDKYGIIPLELEKIAWKTLHGKTAAAVARSEFSAPEAVAQAIASHTTGRRGMTRMDQILYLADFIEETRDFDGVEPARQLAFENLDRAMIYCLEFSLRDLLERHLPIHPDTVDALNELYLKKKDS